MPKKVVILGGGVAGMSAAHELIQRGFEVTVFERLSIPGGKARSFSVPGTDLPAEHGFRIFAAFYRHLFHTMKRIPLSGKTAPTGQTVFDNLVSTQVAGRSSRSL